MSNANPLSNQTTSRKAKTMTTETAQTDPMIDHDVEAVAEAVAEIKKVMRQESDPAHMIERIDNIMRGYRWVTEPAAIAEAVAEAGAVAVAEIKQAETMPQ